MIRLLLILAVLLFGGAGPVQAAPAGNPVEVLVFADEAQEQHFRGLVAEFRCPKCLNTNLLGSDAPIARDLRQAVYRLSIEEGRSDEAVRDYLQQRYGDFVLYSPPLKASTVLLWFGPLLLLIAGLLVWRRTVRAAATTTPGSLSTTDRERLNKLLDAD
ncbi:MAG: cytochrome c-type biogenesis protein [Pseudomonadota bacterium]